MAAVLGLSILVIILGIITYFENYKYQLSQERFYATLKSAMNTPTSELLKEKKVLFKGGEIYSSQMFEKVYSIPSECFSVQSPMTQLVKTIGTNSVQILQPTQLDVFYRCDPAGICPAGCNTCCTISFGREP